MRIMYSIMYSVYCIYIYCTLYNIYIQYTLYIIHTAYTVLSTLYPKLCTKLCILNFNCTKVNQNQWYRVAQCTMYDYDIHYTLYTTVYSIHTA